MSPDEALREPRLHHQGAPDEVAVRGLDEGTRSALAARGHLLREQPFMGHVQAIEVRDEAPRLRAGSDPQKGGTPAGE
jgi:gamma-glutamyltranspeptidase